jgi:hypothetical protein
MSLSRLDHIFTILQAFSNAHMWPYAKPLQEYRQVIASGAHRGSHARHDERDTKLCARALESTRRMTGVVGRMLGSQNVTCSAKTGRGSAFESNPATKPAAPRRPDCRALLQRKSPNM